MFKEMEWRVYIKVTEPVARVKGIALYLKWQRLLMKALQELPMGPPGY
jgi:hypothetical protein